MSIPVELADLEAKTSEYGWAYLLTVRDDQTPHIVSVSPRWDEGALLLSVGKGTERNAAARTSISLCYPPSEPDGYSLIVDGAASSGGDQIVRFAPSGAVLHRSAAPGFTASATGCANDCLPIDAAST